MPRIERPRDPYAAYNFQLEMAGVIVAGFSECSGLAPFTRPNEYWENRGNASDLKLPGIQKFATITLKRGFSESQELLKWLSAVDGQSERRSGSIALMNETGEEVMRWSFHQGRPNKWNGPRLNPRDNELAIETLEIAVESLAVE